MHARVINRFGTREHGQTMVEYAIVLGVITPAILVAIGFLAGSVQGSIERVFALLESVL